MKFLTLLFSFLDTLSNYLRERTLLEAGKKERDAENAQHVLDNMPYDDDDLTKRLRERAEEKRPR